MDSKQFKSNENYIRKAAGKEIPARLMAMVVFGLHQATQVATDDNPDLRPNCDFLTRTRQLVKDCAPRGKNSVQQFDSYIIGVCPMLEVTGKGKVKVAKDGVMEEFDRANLEDIDGQYWKVELPKSGKTPQEKLEAAITRAKKEGISVEGILEIIQKIFEDEGISLNVTEEELDKAA